MLVPAVERDREDRARLPLEGDARAGIVPDRGRAAAGEDHDHLLEQMMARLQLLAGRDLADVAVVGGARGLVVDEHALGGVAAARPGLQLDGAQVGHVLRADDVEPVVAHEAQIGRVLLGLELLRHFLGNEHVLGHGMPPCASVAVARAADHNSSDCNGLAAAAGLPQCCRGRPCGFPRHRCGPCP